MVEGRGISIKTTNLIYLVVTGAARNVTPRGATVGVASVETDTFTVGTSTSFSSLIGLRLNRVRTVVEFLIATFIYHCVLRAWKSFEITSWCQTPGLFFKSQQQDMDFNFKQINYRPSLLNSDFSKN